MTDKQIDEVCRFLNIPVNASKYRTDDIYLACGKLVSSEPCWAARGCFSRGGFPVQSGWGVDEWASANNWRWGCFVRGVGLVELEHQRFARVWPDCLMKKFFSTNEMERYFGEIPSESIA